MEIRENGYYYDIDEYSDEVEIEIKNSQVWQFQCYTNNYWERYEWGKILDVYCNKDGYAKKVYIRSLECNGKTEISVKLLVRNAVLVEDN
jgi:hypothetical protein